MNFLTEVIAHKKQEVASRKRSVSLADMVARAKKVKGKQRSFFKALKHKPIALIAEIKRKSPSLGALSNGSILSIAKTYAQSEASAVSVLTDEKYFSGSLSFLEDVRQICKQPILRKDFIIDPYQVYESKVAGADAILLIVAVLSLKRLREFLSLAQSLSLDALVEVHSKGELTKALRGGATIIGINNRNLKTLKINLTTTDDIMCSVPRGTKVVFVSESGISTRADAKQVKRAGVHAILVGSAIMQSKNRIAKIRELSLR